jgi:acyl-CoA hydrolase
MMEGKRVNESCATIAHVMQPQDANPAGNVHGGVIMKYIDTAAGVVAVRHARCNAVTASIDRLDFYTPVFIGNLLTLKAGVNMVGNTSMEIGVRVTAEDLLSGEVRHIASAYLTFVALDEAFKPKRIPPLILASDNEKRRNREAAERKKMRLAEKKKENQAI